MSQQWSNNLVLIRTRCIDVTHTLSATDAAFNTIVFTPPRSSCNSLRSLTRRDWLRLFDIFFLVDRADSIQLG